MVTVMGKYIHLETRWVKHGPRTNKSGSFPVYRREQVWTGSQPRGHLLGYLCNHVNQCFLRGKKGYRESKNQNKTKPASFLPMTLREGALKLGSQLGISQTTFILGNHLHKISFKKSPCPYSNPPNVALKLFY